MEMVYFTVMVEVFLFGLENSKNAISLRNSVLYVKEGFEMYRNTYVEVNLKNVEKNVKTLINKYSDYKYHFGVVKADSYGHNGIQTVQAIIRGGCNYITVATLDEALEIRKDIKDIPILCLGIIPIEYIEKCIENNITITISNLDYLKKLITKKFNKLKVHIKINTGMNRLGVNNKEEFNNIYKIIQQNNVILEGIYTHIYSSSEEKNTLRQFKKFEEITSDIDLNDVPIIHIGASDATINYSKLSYANGCRLGIAMYGLMENKELGLLPTFSLYSEIIQINDVENETVGYNGAYLATNKDKIAVVPIGYADGIIRKNTGRNVYINDKSYNIVGNVCMDMLFVKVDESVKVGDKVTLIKDIEHIEQIAKHLDTISYEVLCSIGKRVTRVYIDDKET